MTKAVLEPQAADAASNDDAGILPEHYRAGMRHFPAAVHIATTHGPAGRRGITVSAACSVSDRPATLLICVNREHAQNRLFSDNGCFALNTLAVGDVALSRAFATSSLTQDERFAHGQWDELETGAPILRGAAAAFDCVITGATDAHTHTVLFGQVRAIRVNDAASPLLYVNRHYHFLGDIVP